MLKILSKKLSRRFTQHFYKKLKNQIVYILQNEYTKYITASEKHSQSRSFQTTVTHLNQLNL